jgi:hypothetical protein
MIDTTEFMTKVILVGLLYDLPPKYLRDSFKFKVDAAL